MKARESPHSIHSRSQLLFMGSGMERWLETIGDIIPAAAGCRPAMIGGISIPCELEENALRLLTDMALHTWKEAG